MFGYVRPYKPFLRMCEYEGYRSIYCGVCKTIAREFGELPRFSLSYDVVILALLDMGIHNIELKAEMQHCIVHPITRRNIAVSEGLEYSANAAVILLYHKLMDDRNDGRGIEGFLSSAAGTAVRGAYLKARKRYPALARQVEKQMKAQTALERENCPSTDRACEPTARIMQAVFSGLTDEPEQRKQLGRFGYFLGRYVYLTDALDDLRRDSAKGRYNPLLSGIASGTVTDGDFARAADRTAFSVSMSLGQLAEAYCRIDIKMYKSILDNIVYLGLGNVFKQVKDETFRKKDKERNIKL
ncbi:MAG: hypothetical protein IKN17_11075 [Ruminococcus sp.]|nr:hypothetical protein [Ruminococcus sp.]